MSQYTVTANVKIDDTYYAVGDTVELNEARAAELSAAGLVEQAEGGGQTADAPLDQSDQAGQESAPEAPKAYEPPAAETVPDGFPTPAQPTPEQIADDIESIEGPSHDGSTQIEIN